MMMKRRIGNSLIVSVDQTSKKELPFANDGNGVHWVQLFGFYQTKDDYYFLTNTFNKYCIWSGKEIFKSNHRLPTNDAMPYIIYTGNEKCEFKASLTDSEIAAHKAAGRRVVKPSLQKFKLSVFSYLSPFLKANAVIQALDQSQASCLNLPVSIGYTNLKEILLNLKKPITDYCIPSVWPNMAGEMPFRRVPFLKRQPGSGLFALKSMLDYGHSAHDEKKLDVSIPAVYVTKKDHAKSGSLFQLAQKQQLTRRNEIMGVTALGELSKTIGCHQGTLVAFNDSWEFYINALCGELKKGKSLAIAIDANWKCEIPEATQGDGFHWAHVFGFYQTNDDTYFLVSAYGKYLAWSGMKMFESHNHLPSPDKIPAITWNPKTVCLSEYLLDEQLILELQQPERTTNAVPDDFRFKAFSYPTPALHCSLKL
jgi:hypothetical protein